MLLFSINPRFAHMILRGEKTIELRRRVPRCSSDFWMALYATSPEQSLVGLVQAVEILVDRPEGLWERVKNGCAISEKDFQSYFARTERAFGIRLNGPLTLEKPLRLDSLRGSWPEFRPPRSFAYLAKPMINAIWEQAQTATKLAAELDSASVVQNQKTGGRILSHITSAASTKYLNDL